MRTRLSGRTSPLVYEPEIERLVRRNRATQNRLETHVSNSPQSQNQNLSSETINMDNQPPNNPQNPQQNQPARSGGSRRPPTPPHINQPQNQPQNTNHYTHFQNNQNRNTQPNQPVLNRNNPTFVNQGRVSPNNQPNAPRNQFENVGNHDHDRISIHTYHSGEDEYDDEGFGYGDNEDQDDVNLGYMGFDDGYASQSNVGEWNDFEAYHEYESEDNYGNLPREQHHRRNRHNHRQYRGPQFVGRAERRPQQQHGNEVNDQRREAYPPPQGVNGRFRPAITENTSPIIPPVQGRRSFVCKPNYINILPHFHGMSTEDPYAHLAEFSSLCASN